MTVVSSKPGGSGSPVRGAAVIAALGERLWRLAGTGELSRWLWYDRSVRWQLLASFVLINLVTGSAAGVIVIYNAREATAVEVAASMEVAEQVVRRTADQLAREPSNIPESLSVHALEILPLRLRHLRHVRISIADASGRPVSVQPADVDGAHGRHAAVPRWFGALIRFDDLSREVPVILGGRHIGTVLVTSQPADEIAEVWQDVSEIAVVVLIANFIVVGLFFVALGRVLNPLTSLATGLRELEQGRFRHRLPRPRVREFADIVDRFNALAGALEAARTDNARLNRRLVTVQDDERREIATELHDELGACLFGLRANVLSVQRLAESLPPGSADLMRKRAETLVEVSERIQTTNRRILRRIRPMALGNAALADVIADLVADFERNDPDHTFKLDIGSLRRGYGDCIDLTVYRCVQEGLTNAMRHAEAEIVAIGLEELTTPAADADAGSASVQVRLSVSDDGCGFVPGAASGLGLTGMERRVRALGGAFAISSRPGGGTCLDITIPVEEAEPGASALVQMRSGRQ
ncbi:MAG TPA: ATP-binding protein [Hyphomicrobiaceae bacterium]|jgi:two-component system sensor histidine kinase UhpB|nr:ATP-binding protein [Hyphomicrobiaceae bacterium]